MMPEERLEVRRPGEVTSGERIRREEMQEKNIIEEEKIRELLELALKQREFSYAPYSGFRVGAALLAENGQIYTGCNIENAAYGPSNCAERTAIFKAVSKGVKNFQAICIAGGGNEGVTKACPPCGVCRQVMLEFCKEDFLIILAAGKEAYELYTLGELAPLGFSL